MRVIGAAMLMGLALSISNGTAQTFWLPPVDVVSHTGTSHTLFTEPMLAKSGDGTIGLLWHGHWGITTGTESYRIVMERHSDVFLSYSEDVGNTWSPARQISDSRVLSHQGQLVGGSGKEFYPFWTSGDPISSYRLHTAETTDAGATYTSHTFIQTDNDYDTGFFQPSMAVSGANQVMVRSALWKLFQRYFYFEGQYFTYHRDQVVSYRAIGDDQWTTATSWRIANDNNLLSSAIFDNSIATNGADILLTSEVSNRIRPTYSYSRLMISRNSGIDWTTTSTSTLIPEPVTHPRSLYVASDGESDWLLFGLSLDATTSTHGTLFVQKSSDFGTTWTAPTFIAPNLTGVTSAVSDGLGRWLVILRGHVGEPISYVWSSDYGVTWSDIEIIPRTQGSARGERAVSMGNGRWGIAWADGDTVKLSRLLWGNTTVDGWMLY